MRVHDNIFDASDLSPHLVLTGAPDKAGVITAPCWNYLITNNTLTRKHTSSVQINPVVRALSGSSICRGNFVTSHPESLSNRRMYWYTSGLSGTHVCVGNYAHSDAVEYITSTASAAAAVTVNSDNFFIDTGVAIPNTP